jgi:single-strand DNA-binding protein
MNLNRATIIGNLTRDPEVKTIPSGQTVANFSVATNLIWKDSQTGEQKTQVEYHNIVAWRRLGEICGQYLKKGSKIYIEGRLQTRSWDDQNGVKHYRTEINADNMIMLDRANQSGGQQTGGEAPAAPQAPAPAPQADNSENSEEIKVENIPF